MMTIIATHIDVQGLCERWSPCGQAADYLARYAASGAFDPERQATVLSALLNEVLEFAFEAADGDDGAVALSLDRDGDALVIHARIPGAPAPTDDPKGAGVRALAQLHDAALSSTVSEGAADVTLRITAEQQQEGAS